MKSVKKLVAMVLAVSLMGIVGSAATNAADTLPRTNFPMCSDTRNIYCIESVNSLAGPTRTYTPS